MVLTGRATAAFPPQSQTSEDDSLAGPSDSSTAAEMVAEGREGNLPAPPSSENGRGSSLPDVFITGAATIPSVILFP